MRLPALVAALVLVATGCVGSITGASDAKAGGAVAEEDAGAAPRDDARTPDGAPRADGGAANDTSPVEELPAPPGVGVMHTTAQLDFMRAHRAELPWQAAYDQLLADAEGALTRIPEPSPVFDVPGGYVDPDGQAAAKERLRQDAFAAYAAALGYQLADTAAKRREHATRAAAILDAWAAVNTEVTGDDGDLVLMYAGVTLIYAADLIMGFDGWTAQRRAAFRYWAASVYWDSAMDIEGRANNWGAWGTLGAVAVAALVGNGPALAERIGNLQQRIADSIDANGELPEENRRTNSGMWYTYFALTAMTAAAHIVRNVAGVDLFAYTAPTGRSLRLALERDFYYALDPEAWPYLLPDGLEGELWRALYPCADEVELPTVTGWPGPLFEIMADVYQAPAWRDWVVDARPLTGYHAWRYVTLMRQTP